MLASNSMQHGTNGCLTERMEISDVVLNRNDSQIGLNKPAE